MKLLVDSDCLVGAFRDEDPHHSEALTLLKKYGLKGDTLSVLNLVLQETATVLSHRTGMNAVRLFYEKYPALEMGKIDISGELENYSWEVFLKQTKKGTSFVDCANLAANEYYHLDGILSFDRFYSSKLIT